MAFAQQPVLSIPATNRADAFVNVWIKRADGTRAKLGAIPLKHSTAYQAGVIDRLNTGGEEAIAALMAALEIDFKLASSEPVKASAVGF
jgi:hypothetical protein